VEGNDVGLVDVVSSAVAGLAMWADFTRREHYILAIFAFGSLKSVTLSL
jgi:hypothetical protein